MQNWCVCDFMRFVIIIVSLRFCRFPASLKLIAQFQPLSYITSLMYENENSEISRQNENKDSYLDFSVISYYFELSRIL